MPDHHHPEVPMDDRPTAKQQRYLRDLAEKTGRTFVSPKTKREASREIARLKATPRSSRSDRLVEREPVAPRRASAAVAQPTTGYGSTATWA